MIGETTIYVVSAALLGVVAVAFGYRTRGLPESTRRYGFAAVVGTASMCVAYLLMAGDVLLVETTGREQSAARFFGYTVTWAAFVYILGAVASASRRNTALLLVFILWVQWSTLLSWVVAGTTELLVSVSSLVALAVVVGLLFGPFTRRARETTGDRYLLFSKVKFLTVLGWAGLVTTAIVSEQNLALVGMFVGQLLATYIDVVILLGLCGLVFGNVSALEETAAGTVEGDARSTVERATEVTAARTHSHE